MQYNYIIHPRAFQKIRLFYTNGARMKTWNKMCMMPFSQSTGLRTRFLVDVQPLHGGQGIVWQTRNDGIMPTALMETQ